MAMTYLGYGNSNIFRESFSRLLQAAGAAVAPAAAAPLVNNPVAAPAAQPVAPTGL